MNDFLSCEGCVLKIFALIFLIPWAVYQKLKNFIIFEKKFAPVATLPKTGENIFEMLIAIDELQT